MWKTLNIQSLGEDMIYICQDESSTIDVFRNFSKLCQKYYDTDYAHLLTAFSLAWQACLKMTETHLELLTDIDILLTARVAKNSQFLGSENKPGIMGNKPGIWGGILEILKGF